jgi:hypothetical protein
MGKEREARLMRRQLNAASYHMGQGLHVP